MGVTAKQLLSGLNPTDWSYQNMVISRARDCAKILDKLTAQGAVGFQQELCKDYLLVEKGYPASRSLPNWAFRLAWVLYDPQQEFSPEVKSLVANYCREMLDEFKKGRNRLIKRFKDERDFPLLPEIAKDLDVEVFGAVIH